MLYNAQVDEMVKFINKWNDENALGLTFVGSAEDRAAWYLDHYILTLTALTPTIARYEVVNWFEETWIPYHPGPKKDMLQELREKYNKISLQEPLDEELQGWELPSSPIWDEHKDELGLMAANASDDEMKEQYVLTKSRMHPDKTRDEIEDRWCSFWFRAAYLLQEDTGPPYPPKSISLIWDRLKAAFAIHSLSDPEFKESERQAERNVWIPKMSRLLFEAGRPIDREAQEGYKADFRRRYPNLSSEEIDHKCQRIVEDTKSARTAIIQISEEQKKKRQVKSEEAALSFVQTGQLFALKRSKKQWGRASLADSDPDDNSYRLAKAAEGIELYQQRKRQGENITWEDVCRIIDWRFGHGASARKLLYNARMNYERLQKSDPERLLRIIAAYHEKKEKKEKKEM